MRYHERLNIVFMRDNGPRRSIRLRRSRFYLLIAFFSSLPFLCILLSIQCWLLWKDNINLRENVERFEADYQDAETRAERLENLEELLKEENVYGRKIILSNLAASSEHAPAQEDNASTVILPENMPEGPGHEEFPVLDTGRVKVSNVQARAMRGNTVRVGLDLHNPDNEHLLSGNVSAVLITSNGEKYSLLFTPHDIGNFRINRFKRTVMSASVPRDISLINSEIILEVKNEDSEPIYRNIFAVQR